MADPWGIPERPAETGAPLWIRAIAKLYGNVNPLWVLRAGVYNMNIKDPISLEFVLKISSINWAIVSDVAGSYGQWVVQKTRPDILRKFQEVVEQHNSGDDNLMAQYIHQCNAQNPT